MITMIKKDNGFPGFIKGKRVIFVGPGSIMNGRGFGNFIDSYDVVIRTNHFPVLLYNDPSLAVDYGRKCSVLYTNMHYYHRHRPLPYDVYKELGFKWLCMKVVRAVDHRSAKNLFSIRTINDIANHLMRSMKTDALMGSVILHDIVSHNPKEFFITGIDFFTSADENYGSYIPGYISEKTQEENLRRGVGQGKGHDLKYNAEYMLSMHDQGHFKTHDFILDIMKQVAT